MECQKGFCQLETTLFEGNIPIGIPCGTQDIPSDDFSHWSKHQKGALLFYKWSDMGPLQMAL